MCVLYQILSDLSTACCKVGDKSVSIFMLLCETEMQVRSHQFGSGRVEN